MMFHPDKKQRRQEAYRTRAKRAFLLAKLMIPLCFLTVSASAWSDPVLGPRLEAGLDEVKPMVEAVIDGTPVMEVLAEVTGRTPPTQTAAADMIQDTNAVSGASVSGLPTSVVPVNRPDTPTADQ